MKAGKTAIATALGCDVAELEAYQPTRCKGVFDYDGNLYTSRAIQVFRKLPEGFDWKKHSVEWFERKYQIEIFVTSQEATS